jgi:tetratricopeptide (TPR) repeat protein
MFGSSKVLRAGVVVFVLALALRLVYLAGYRSNPFFADPQMDALYHDRWARSLAAGDWLGSEVFFRSPLYPYFLGVVYALTGGSYLAPRLIQCLIGALSCVLVFRIGRRLHGPGTGFVAGIMAAFLGTSIYYEAELLLVVLEIFLFLLTIDLLLVAALNRARGRALTAAWGGGLSLGLASVTRPNFLVLAPAAALFLLLRLRRHGRFVWAAALFMFASGVVLPIATVLLRNYIVGEDFVPIASQGGLNFYLGNNPSADGMAALAPEFRPTWYGGVRDATRLAEEALGRPLKPSEVSDYWFARGLAFVRQSPLASARLTLTKLVLFWQAFEIPNNEDFYFFSRYSFLFRSPILLTFGAVAPLAAAGVALGAGRGRRGLFPIVLVLLYSLSIVAFFVCGRFRAAVVPVLCVPAALFLVEAVSDVKRRRWSGLGPAALALALSGWFVNADFFHLRKRHSFAESYLKLGIFYAAKGKAPEAEAAYRSAIVQDPRFAEGHNNLGVLLMQQARSREALQEFETAYEINPQYPRTLNNLAAWYERHGALDRARDYIDQALASKGDEVEVRYNAGIIYGRQGEFKASAEHFRRLLEIEPGHLAGRVGLGKSLLMMGEGGEAASVFSKVVERDPQFAEAWYFLGIARAKAGDLSGARQAWQECLRVRPDYEAAARQMESLKALPDGGER